MNPRQKQHCSGLSKLYRSISADLRTYFVSVFTVFFSILSGNYFQVFLRKKNVFVAVADW